ncbi:sugar transferase [Loigolactobacillus backii]|uniref:sugar transferase n=1 Tax=Loigolactobacillus backii TaxID=375175 RepID=UPI0022FD51F2|nr:sugar transferase [Loigolactobacillus backii]MDA5388281.1 sugar transferase [Loigolactobacillus backii]MDA5390775.1 sugar transferase [Loigolactobacillus backii]
MELPKEEQHYNSEAQIILNQQIIDHRLVYRSGKRIFDFVASLLGLIILSPLFLLVAILIKLDDPSGPIFYSQVRIGRNGKRFNMFKFRSMVVDADKKLNKLLKYNDVDGAMFKMKDDPRVTGVGRIIRKYSIDELPQLANVLLGHMALVGPRPPLEREINGYTTFDKQRLMVTPGCTGLWQVSGRNDVGFHEMVRLDIEYIKKSNFSYDIWIMFRTVGIMIRPNQAY